MMSYDSFVFWALIVLLCLVALTTGREWWNAFCKMYRHAIEVWKWQPYLGYITGNRKKRKQHDNLESEISLQNSEEDHKSVFPRSRRST